MSGKRLVNAYKNLDKNQAYSLKEAVKIVKENATAKFDETIDLAINLGVDPKHADQMIRGVCQLPHGNGKTVRVAVFARDEKAEEAKAAGVQSASKEPGKKEAGKITMAQVKEIATTKLPDLNCSTVESAMNMVKGQAVSMGIKVTE